MSMLCLMLFLAISAFATGSGLASSVKTDLEDMTKFDYTFYGVSEKGYQEEQQTEIYEKIRCAWINNRKKMQKKFYRSRYIKMVHFANADIKWSHY